MGKKFLALATCVLALSGLLGGCSSKSDDKAGSNKSSAASSSTSASAAETTSTPTVDPKAELAGTWRPIKITKGTQVISGDTIKERTDYQKTLYTLNADGTGLLSPNTSNEQKMNWTLNGDKVTLTAKRTDGSEEKLNGTVKGNEMTFSEGDMTVVFQKA